MKKTGYETNFAGAVETVASTGGMIMPPMMGAAAFIIAEFLSIPYIKVCLHALIPAILYYAAVMIMVHLKAKLLGLEGLDRKSLPSIRVALKKGWHLIISVIILVYLLAENLSPMTAALYSTMFLILVATLRKGTRMSPAQIYDALAKAAKGMCVVTSACACAGIVIGIVTLSGVTFQLSQFITDASGGHLFIALLFTAIVSIIMGMGLPVTACYLLLAILGAPALKMMGADLLGAHMFVFYYGVLSCITPPVAIAAYAGAAVAQGEPMKVAIKACQLGITAFIVPFMFIYEPSLLFIGPLYKVLWTFVTAMCGVVFIGFSLMGYVTTHIGMWMRIPFFIAALLMIYPGAHTDLMGIGIGGILLAVHFFRKKARPV
jgi:TRAP transporter 4TM/12TM fusion protein